MSDVISFIKRLWKSDKFFIVRLTLNLTILLIFSILTLGLWILFPLRKFLETKARILYEPTKDEFVKLGTFFRKAIEIYEIRTLEELKNKYPNYNDHILFTYDRIRIGILTNDFTKEHVIIIRGSMNSNNWITNLLTSIKKEVNTGADIHTGYAVTSEGIYNYLIENNLLKNNYSISLTGSSLGGSLSITLGWLLHIKGNKLKQIYSFANPKISISDYSHLPIISVFNICDPVPYLPIMANLNFYRHQDDRIVIFPQMFNDKAVWYLYKDNIYTDILLSIFLLPRIINPMSHTSYSKYFIQKARKLKVNF